MMPMNVISAAKQYGGKMKVDITEQWKRLAQWYWEQAGGHDGVGMSIWEMLERDYGAFKVRHIINGSKFGMKNELIVKFPDEKSYTAFLLRWG